MAFNFSIYRCEHMIRLCAVHSIHSNLGGRPKECTCIWLHMFCKCVIATVTLGLPAPLVAHNYVKNEKGLVAWEKVAKSPSLLTKT